MQKITRKDYEELKNKIAVNAVVVLWVDKLIGNELICQKWANLQAKWLYNVFKFCLIY